MTGTAQLTAIDRLGLTLLIAILVHGLLILGVSFTIETSDPERVEKSLEIVLSRTPSTEAKPADAEFLADVSQQESGELREETLPMAAPLPPPSLPSPQPVVEPAPEAVAQERPPQSDEHLSVPRRDAPPKPVKRIAPEPTPVEAPRLPTGAELLASTNFEIERLTLELARKEQAYAGRPRHKAISASTQEYKYANYLYAWKKKVEAIGNLNYPEEAKRRQLYGNLVMTVIVRANGTIDGIRVVKSSGYKLLDDAAIRIVKLAAPFAPFPPDIRAEADMLDITRTWQFLSGNKLRSK